MKTISWPHIELFSSKFGIIIAPPWFLDPLSLQNDISVFWGLNF